MKFLTLLSQLDSCGKSVDRKFAGHILFIKIMNINLILFLLVIIASQCISAAQYRLGFNGSVHISDRFGSLSPRAKLILIKALKTKKCQRMGRFC